jgi:hypothetical protein
MRVERERLDADQLDPDRACVQRGTQPKQEPGEREGERRCAPQGRDGNVAVRERVLNAAPGVLCRQQRRSSAGVREEQSGEDEQGSANAAGMLAQRFDRGSHDAEHALLRCAVVREARSVCDNDRGNGQRHEARNPARWMCERDEQPIQLRLRRECVDGRKCQVAQSHKLESPLAQQSRRDGERRSLGRPGVGEGAVRDDVRYGQRTDGQREHSEEDGEVAPHAIESRRERGVDACTGEQREAAVSVRLVLVQRGHGRPREPDAADDERRCGGADARAAAD